MTIRGLADLTPVQIHNEIKGGARFIIYQYTISLLFVTLKKSSDIYFVRAYESKIEKGLIWSLISATLGWWGFPWGPTHTFTALSNNFDGGIDVTDRVLSSVNIDF